MLADLTKRPYVIVGFAALMPLAATSWNGAARRLGGAAWRRLRRLAYPATPLAAVHFVRLVKGWPLEPLADLAAVPLLLGWRRVPRRRRPAPWPAPDWGPQKTVIGRRFSLARRGRDSYLASPPTAGASSAVR